MPITPEDLLTMTFADTLTGGAGPDTVTGGALAELIVGGAGGNRIVAGDGNDGVIGGDGNDTINAGRGNDTVFGGDGNDVIHGEKGFNLLFGGAGDDTITSGDQASVLYGGDGNDVLVARLKLGGAHTLFGGYGPDRFDIILPSEQWNVIVTIGDFDLGYDTFSVFGVEDQVFMNSGVQIQNGPGAVRMELGAREALELTGMTIERLAGVYGFAGNDTLIGSEKFDRLNGGAGDDIIYGNGGNDNIRGGFGNDLIYGGAGNDMINADQGFDTVYGGQGNDTIHGNSGNNHLHGDDGNDLITSGNHASLLYGGDGDDTLVARMIKGAVHVLEGGTGADRFDIIQTGVSAQAGQVVIADFAVGTDSLFIEGMALALYLTAHAPLIEDTAWGAWLTLDTGEIVKFANLTSGDLLLV